MLSSKFLLILAFTQNFCNAYVTLARLSTRPSFISSSTVNEIDVTFAKNMDSVNVDEKIIRNEEETKIDSTPVANLGFQEENNAKRTDIVKKSNSSHKEGVFSPLVLLTKKVVGDEKLKKFRAKVIGLHTDVISSFVKTHETKFGQEALKMLYFIADQNKDGRLDEFEIKSALHKLDFEWIEDKQLKGIVKRADKDGNNVIDFEEFCKEAPRTLKTNLTKLAKKNGGEMGLLV